MACDTTSASSVGLEYMLATGRSTTALGNPAAKRASTASPVISPLRVPQALSESPGGYPRFRDPAEVRDTAKRGMLPIPAFGTGSLSLISVSQFWGSVHPGPGFRLS